MHKQTSNEPANMRWLIRTTHHIKELIETKGEDSEYLIGTYLNDISEVCGRSAYAHWMDLHDDFGLTKYKVSKYKRIAK